MAVPVCPSAGAPTLQCPQQHPQPRGPSHLDPGIAVSGAPSVDGAGVVQPGQVRGPLPCRESAQV